MESLAVGLTHFPTTRLTRVVSWSSLGADTPNIDSPSSSLFNFFPYLPRKKKAITRDGDHSSQIKSVSILWPPEGWSCFSILKKEQSFVLNLEIHTLS
ncbi:hypothetical protein NPIL_208251 [Nephila pilipes]|uniref:Uncharacterized protein n=1 Tax=Nephila pilipes TaxID=299642 RepID=A0A8X6NK63_NEPPI|nr:hypothetical protein NPIL_208251 [Nephila pilipes]